MYEKLHGDATTEQHARAGVKCPFGVGLPMAFRPASAWPQQNGDSAANQQQQRRIAHSPSVPLHEAQPWTAHTQQQGCQLRQPMPFHTPVSRTFSDSFGQTSSARAHARPATLASTRRKLESEDSSYDSDHEAAAAAIARSHDDVSRTTSETLSAEFAEYVNIMKSGAAAATEEDIHRDPCYNTKLEFALRLGYTEAMLQKALLKVGILAAENQILEELIRLQRTRPTAAIEEDPPQAPTQSEVIKRPGSATSLSAPAAPPPTDPADLLLPIVVDGSNVAMSHGNKERFSCKGILLCVDWFRNRGHKHITVFVPMWRKEASRPDAPISDQYILTQLERDGMLSFTPSRQVGGKRYVAHDDRYVLNLAVETGAVVVTNDNYRDLVKEKPEYKKVVEEKILMYSFVNDRFMPPDDPLGRTGPTLDAFLKKKPAQGDPVPCPYGRKCTYGNKCKYFHADRGSAPQKSITDKLNEYSSMKISEVRARIHSRDSSPGDALTRTMSMQPLELGLGDDSVDRQALCRTWTTVPTVTLSQPGEIPSELGYWIRQQQHTPIQSPSSQPSPTQSSVMRMSSLNSWLGDDAAHVAPAVDTRLPPPPPRTPWTNQTSQANENAHRKITRQLTLNPNYDPRIHHQLGAHPMGGIPFPPPSGVPPPTSSSAMVYHAAVTRNASAPESTSAMANPPAPLPSALVKTASAQAHLRRMSSTSDSQLHKAAAAGVIMPPPSALAPVPAHVEKRPAARVCAPSAAAAAAVSPLIGTAGGVWDTGCAARTDVDAAADANPRSKLYYHLAALFPEVQVLKAMSALPDETDVQKICAYILRLGEAEAE